MRVCARREIEREVDGAKILTCENFLPTVLSFFCSCDIEMTMILSNVKLWLVFTCDNMSEMA